MLAGSLVDEGPGHDLVSLPNTAPVRNPESGVAVFSGAAVGGEVQVACDELLVDVSRYEVPHHARELRNWVRLQEVYVIPHPPSASEVNCECRTSDNARKWCRLTEYVWRMPSSVLQS